MLAEDAGAEADAALLAPPAEAELEAAACATVTEEEVMFWALGQVEDQL